MGLSPNSLPISKYFRNIPPVSCCKSTNVMPVPDLLTFHALKMVVRIRQSEVVSDLAAVLNVEMSELLKE